MVSYDTVIDEIMDFYTWGDKPFEANLEDGYVTFLSPSKQYALIFCNWDVEGNDISTRCELRVDNFGNREKYMQLTLNDLDGRELTDTVHRFLELASLNGFDENGNEDNAFYQMTSIDYKVVEIRAEYFGDRDADWGNISNHHRNEITITTQYGEATFDFWTSIMHPNMENYYDVMSAFRTICDEGLMVCQEEAEEMVYDDEDPMHARKVLKAMEDNYAKLEEIGLGDEDTLINICNNEEWQ